MKSVLSTVLKKSAVAALGVAPSFGELRITPGRAGFFGEVFCAINGLRLAERHGLRATMAWGSRSPYFDPERSQNDAWSTYFAVSEYDFRLKNSSRSSPFYLRHKPGAYDFEPYVGMSIRQSAGHALRAWCQPHAEIAASVEEIHERLFAKRSMLGVHVRLTDAAAGNEGRKTVGLESFFEATDKWLSDHSGSGIFLATDEARVTDAFVARYGELVNYQNCLRSDDGTSIHGHYDSGVYGNPYDKGREVFIDALLLARCDHLIRTHSRVTAFSLCWSPELSFRDLELDLTGDNRTPWLHEPAH